MPLKPDIANRDDWDLLILRYLDDTLCPADSEQVLKLLDNADFQLLLANYALDQVELHEVPSPAFVGGARLTGGRSAKTGMKSKPPSHYKWSAAAAVAFLAIATLIATRSFKPVAEPALPKLKRTLGEVVVDEMDAAVGASIRAGQRVHTRTPMSFAALQFADGTEIQLAGETIVACQELQRGKNVHVLAGSVSASVRPQPANKPLVIQTPTASMEVLGTDLAVSASPDRTRLNVATGSVRMKDTATDDSIVVNRGEFAVASTAQSLKPQRSSLAPDEWAVDFEKGLPKGWQGALVKGDERLHNGALRAERTAADRPHSVTSIHGWSEGLFRIHRDTCVNFRIKLDRPQWYQIILCIRDDNYRAPEDLPIRECQEAIDFSQVEPGAWRTVSLPISAFRLPQQSTEKYTERPDYPPPEGSIAFLLLFATLEGDIGLEIDRIWVTRGTPSAHTSSVESLSNKRDLTHVSP